MRGHPAQRGADNDERKTNEGRDENDGGAAASSKASELKLKDGRASAGAAALGVRPEDLAESSGHLLLLLLARSQRSKALS